MTSPLNLLTALGPDTVELVRRVPVTAGTPPAPVLDAWNRPQVTNVYLTKHGCSFTVTGGTEEVAGSTIAVLDATGALPVDADTEALAPGDAIRFQGRVFELTTPGVRHDGPLGRPSHVRVFARWAGEAGLGEQVTVIPAGGRHDGVVSPDGAPIALIARAVMPGNTTVRYRDSSAAAVTADFTVVLDVDAPVNDGDWLIVRGRECRAVIERQESQWAARRELVVLAQYRGGGRT
ncbi:hypothetical protein LV457_02885 [Mycobacterium sp. MYCO198283]|uniref:hypothetical protein n=1 Tax=Mycobacterium sp. MYCO198283 TaxID=2883505 RepID=UPI001E4E2671|nr:hypothetical protein [Mycobacterium sp. MYCO198283]MCG5431235.1 hypothetical protein [Mycobacterium sp. MYCO198283]